jgi:hypothetical protein
VLDSVSMDERMTTPVVMTREQLASKSMRELKEMLVSKGFSLAGLSEKSDLVDVLLGSSFDSYQT